MASIADIEERIVRQIEELRNRTQNDRNLIENLERDVVGLFEDLRRRNGANEEQMVRLFLSI